MNDDNLDPELDALLATARWPEPAAQAEQQLRERWHELSGARPRRLLRIDWLAAAAVLVLVFGGTWFLWTQGGRVPTEIAQVPNTPLPPMVTSSPRPMRPAPIAAQAPTPRERLAVLATPPVVDTKEAVRKAIDVAIEGEDAAAVALLQPLRANPVERELAMAFASTTEHPRRRAVIRLLSAVGGPSTLALLTRIAKDPMLASDAMPGVARLGGAESLVALARTSQSEPRREAIAHLLTIQTESVVPEFLAMVLNDATRDDALASLRGSAAPPVDELIAALDDAHIDRRFAAAKALGSLCNRTDVGEALRRMVNTNRHRREALAALLSCTSSEATTFINTARTRASIDAEVRAVQTELQRMF